MRVRAHGPTTLCRVLPRKLELQVQDLSQPLAADVPQVPRGQD